MRALCVSLFTCAGAAVLRHRVGSNSSVTRENAAFMVTNGVTAGEEQCLTIEHGRVEAVGAELVVMSCLDAIAMGDGREFFSFQSGGLLMSVVGKHCVALAGNEVAGGGALALESCDAIAKSSDGRGKFEMQGATRARARARAWIVHALTWRVAGSGSGAMGTDMCASRAGNGQIKLGRDGDYCVSHRGGGDVNVALHAAASASSTADAVAHNAGMAVDGRADTFWASRFGDAEKPVEFVIDLGAPQKLAGAEIQWAYAAKEFAFHLYSEDTWVEAWPGRWASVAAQLALASSCLASVLVYVRV